MELVVGANSEETKLPGITASYVVFQLEMNYPAASGRGIRDGIDFLAASSGVLDPLVNKYTGL